MVEEMDCNLFAPDDEEEEFIDNDQETGAHIGIHNIYVCFFQQLST